MNCKFIHPQAFIAPTPPSSFHHSERQATVAARCINIFRGFSKVEGLEHFTEGTQGGSAHRGTMSVHMILRNLPTESPRALIKLLDIHYLFCLNYLDVRIWLRCALCKKKYIYLGHHFNKALIRNCLVPSICSTTFLQKGLPQCGHAGM